MDPSGPIPRYLTLRDYLQVFRRYWILIAAAALLGAVAGYITAKSQTAIFESKAVVQFQDPAQDANLVGLSTGGSLTPLQVASVASETVGRPSVTAEVFRKLRSPLIFSSSVVGQVSQASGLLYVAASSSDPGFAARLANTVATVLVAQSNAQAQSRFALLYRDAQRQIAKLRGSHDSISAAVLPFYTLMLPRLGTLSRFAREAEFVQAAQPDPKPISPKTQSSTLIGLALGLLLGIAAAFLRDVLDRRLRSARDVESHVRLPILGHVRKEMMGGLAYAANGAAPPSRADQEAFRIVRRNLELLNVDAPPRSIVVTSATAEEGKSTVAGSLAFAIASSGKRTLLVDCDLRHPTLAARLGADPYPGISDYLAGEAPSAQVLRTVRFSEPLGTDGNRADDFATTPGVYSLVFIPSGTARSNPSELLGSERFREFFEQVSQSYERIVLDSSPLLPVADTLEMLPSVDSVVVCMRAGKTTNDQAEAVQAALSRFKLSTGVVLTGIKQNRDIEAYVYNGARTKLPFVRPFEGGRRAL